MKTVIKIICIGFISIWAVSCESFLTEDPKGQLASVNFFKSRKDLDLAMHSLYYQVAYYGNNNEHYPSYVAGADLSTNPRMTGAQHDWEIYAPTGTDSYAKQQWADLYLVIKQANFTIQYAENEPVDETTLDAYMAQAYFWRAWAYFHLVTTWGAVPMILTDAVDYEVSVPTVAEIWEKVILPDIEKAEKAPVKWSNISGAASQASIGGNAWVTQAAAKAAAAYLYLSYAGWPNNKTEYYAKAAAKAKEVIDGVENGTYPYALFDQFWKINSKQYETSNSESLLSVYYNRYASSGAMGTYDSYMAPSDVAQYKAGKAVQGPSWNEYHGEIKFWKEFPEGPRKDAIYAPKTLILDPDNTDSAILVDWWDTRRDETQRQPWFIRMMTTVTTDANNYPGEWDYTRGMTAISSTTDKAHTQITLAEVFCWYAEAVGRSGSGDKAKAVQLLNTVRNRADGAQTNLYSAGISNEALAEAACKEHGWEVAGLFYGPFAPQYFDMFRMNRVQEHFNYRVSNPGIEVAPGVICKELSPVTGSWNESRIYAPYHADDANINPNLER